MSAHLVLHELTAARKSLDTAAALILQSLLTTEVLTEADPISQQCLPPGPAITVVTENGFSIVRLCDLEESLAHSANGCQFLVSGFHGYEQRIKVVFSEAAITLLQRETSARILSRHRFWVQCSELHLARYLWKNHCGPPNQLLVVDEVTTADLLLARRSEL